MALFIKVVESFILSDSKDKTIDAKDKKPIVGRFEKIKPDTMNVFMGEHVGFLLGPTNIVSGNLTMEVNDKNIEVNCNAIFKISVRPQHEESFLSGKEKWRFGYIQQGQFGDDLVGDVTSGTLDIVEAIMSGVTTSSKKTDLK